MGHTEMSVNNSDLQYYFLQIQTAVVNSKDKGWEEAYEPSPHCAVLQSELSSQESCSFCGLLWTCSDRSVSSLCWGTWTWM